MNHKKIKNNIFVGAIAIVLLSGIIIFTQGVREDNIQAVKLAETKSQAYGFSVAPRQAVKCLNGWLLVNLGNHAWVYPRDENFDPIECNE